MFERIIVATDLSEWSFTILKRLEALRTFDVKECLLLQCLNVQELASVAFSYTTAHIEENLARQKEILEGYGFVTKARTMAGSAKSEINQIAEMEGFSLIVVGSRGNSKTSDTSLGPVASEVIKHARKPVLVIRIGGHDDANPNHFQFDENILFSTDFSENADHVFTYLEKMVQEGARRVTLLHIQDENEIEPQQASRLDGVNETSRERLEKLKRRLEKSSNAEIDIDLIYGSPYLQIMKAIKDQKTRLVVMGTQGRGRIKDLFIGSVGHKIARHAAASVMLIPNES